MQLEVKIPIRNHLLSNCRWCQRGHRDRDTFKGALAADTTIYSGSAPKGMSGNWQTAKSQNASAFIENQVPAMVATKAFGMGIDKPNVRYIVHMGMPGSLESYYQEAGRAGRDRKKALCVVIFSEADEQRTRRMLALH